MVFGISSDQDYVVYSLRRQELRSRLKEQYPDVQKASVLLFGAFEPAHGSFVQESSFYYVTGLSEPGIVALLHDDGNMTIYQPHYAPERTTWHTPSLLEDNQFCVQQRISIKELGQQLSGHTIRPFDSQEKFKNLCDDLEALLAGEKRLFVACPAGQAADVGQRVLFERCAQWLPSLNEKLIDVAPIISTMRRGKDAGEIEMITRAVDITVMAHEAALQALAAGVYECEVQANIEFVFTASGALPAFNTIVASGKNATTLHYSANSDVLKNGELTIIDCGAQIEHYCADISRTYPVSKKFTARQKELYQLVLDAQEYIASKAQAGFWLCNKEVPEKSLTHVAQSFFAKKGYADYFKHNIGHFVGLDVHDVGGMQQPLQEGDVITIEPGLYLSEENIGIRIEDMYWITKKGAVCLTDFLPRAISDIEQLMEHIDASEFESEECVECDSCCEHDDCDDCCHDS